ncbi:NUDIX hydrolase [Nocardia noduli]|uniref:NUDIX hydrolase n=1 Tax=Nocardia noduli TaxID=2815722 RepID=UPI001C229038|nr:NUDIX domain-containing protein [Nocardia noduli]
MEPTPEQDKPVLRPTVRLLILDEKDRLLMFSGTDDSDGHTFWFPIGGGREEGETLEQTAAREAREETGLTELSLGPEVWRRRAIGSWGGTTYDCREHYFLVRVGSFDIDTAGFTDDERTSITGHHWWTLDELNATSDRLVPGNLRSLLADLLRSGPPEKPITLTH